jgi:hypothetical protein
MKGEKRWKERRRWRQRPRSLGRDEDGDAAGLRMCLLWWCGEIGIEDN